MASVWVNDCLGLLAEHRQPRQLKKTAPSRPASALASEEQSLNDFLQRRHDVQDLLEVQFASDGVLVEVTRRRLRYLHHSRRVVRVGKEVPAAVSLPPGERMVA
jgi:hypothetical protein